MFPIDSLINVPAAPLGSCIELSGQRELARFNRSALLYARLQPAARHDSRERPRARIRLRPRASPTSRQRLPIAPRRIVRRLTRQ